jgi:hypothetical protein
MGKQPEQNLPKNAINATGTKNKQRVILIVGNLELLIWGEIRCCSVRTVFPANQSHSSRDETNEHTTTNTYTVW